MIWKWLIYSLKIYKQLITSNLFIYKYNETLKKYSLWKKEKTDTTNGHAKIRWIFI